MAPIPIAFGTRKVVAHKSIIAPAFESKTVLVENAWDYVTMWLKRKNQSDALFYWEQGRHFFDASSNLPNESAPLTSYYFALNAAKVLLLVRGASFSESHGVSGRTKAGRTCLLGEVVTFERRGVLGALCAYMRESASGEEYNLKDIFYNLPYIHRAYNLTFSSQTELFIPVANPRFVRKENSEEAWFCCDIEDSRYANGRTMNKLPDAYERDTGIENVFVVRRKKRFSWKRAAVKKRENLDRLTNYHRKIRRDLYYIHGPERLWYLKRGQDFPQIIQRSSLTLTFGAMHRLSELARYEPMKLARHFDCQHNWLLCEFIKSSRDQFLDEISAEITGQDFMTPGRR